MYFLGTYSEYVAEITIMMDQYALDSYTEQLDRNRQDRLVLEKKFREYKNKVEGIEEKLKVEHDLNKLLQAKPEMILKRVNVGTELALKDIEEASGAIINDNTSGTP